MSEKIHVRNLNKKKRTTLKSLEISKCKDAKKQKVWKRYLKKITPDSSRNLTKKTSSLQRHSSIISLYWSMNFFFFRDQWTFLCQRSIKEETIFKMVVSLKSNTIMRFFEQQKIIVVLEINEEEEEVQGRSCLNFGTSTMSVQNPKTQVKKQTGKSKNFIIWTPKRVIKMKIMMTSC